jgi:hypothetical protein
LVTPVTPEVAGSSPVAPVLCPSRFRRGEANRPLDRVVERHGRKLFGALGPAEGWLLTRWTEYDRDDRRHDHAVVLTSNGDVWVGSDAAERRAVLCGREQQLRRLSPSQINTSLNWDAYLHPFEHAFEQVAEQQAESG